MRAGDDLLSWLRPENVVLSGPPLSESDGIESWVEGIVTRWEKQHGPIAKKELGRRSSDEARGRAGPRQRAPSRQGLGRAGCPRSQGAAAPRNWMGLVLVAIRKRFALKTKPECPTKLES